MKRLEVPDFETNPTFSCAKSEGLGILEHLDRSRVFSNKKKKIEGDKISRVDKAGSRKGHLAQE